jgi:hypothetical protein
VVGRELHNTCPLGEDHRGGGSESAGRDSCNNIWIKIGSRRCRVTKMGMNGVALVLSLVGKSLPDVQFPMSCFSMMGRLVSRGRIQTSILRMVNGMTVRRSTRRSTKTRILANPCRWFARTQRTSLHSGL